MELKAFASLPAAAPCVPISFIGRRAPDLLIQLLPPPKVRLAIPSLLNGKRRTRGSRGVFVLALSIRTTIRFTSLGRPSSVVCPPLFNDGVDWLSYQPPRAIWRAASQRPTQPVILRHDALRGVLEERCVIPRSIRLLTSGFLFDDRLQKVLRRHVDLAIEFDGGEFDEATLASG